MNEDFERLMRAAASAGVSVHSVDVATLLAELDHGSAAIEQLDTALGIIAIERASRLRAEAAIERVREFCADVEAAGPQAVTIKSVRRMLDGES